MSKARLSAAAGGALSIATGSVDCAAPSALGSAVGSVFGATCRVSSFVRCLLYIKTILHDCLLRLSKPHRPPWAPLTVQCRPLEVL